MKTTVVKTQDGSHTLFSLEFNEHYHSVFGAIQESQHVFIKNGIQQIDKNPIRVFEVGFGTGLNAFLTLEYALKNNLNVDYHAIEKFPIDNKTISELNLPKLISEKDTELFNKLHQAQWNKEEKINENFNLLKIKSSLENYSFSSIYDIVFFDAFSADTQSELWTKEIFSKIYNSLDNNALLTTYSSKGLVKRNLRSAGFKVKRLAGPKGKFHILNAWKE
ncbi:MAG: tRNA (5-methylaminomethyl-2-thiouridine)(34)-methyltransferase MnmD [Bacteroidota bacterium]|nr:tRNA (5-methylaminomethyl-2-thiouridine)(34)-methyltransferase MnmD [Bacteroidota bacterium]